jgi:hypothetical protein
MLSARWGMGRLVYLQILSASPRISTQLLSIQHRAVKGQTVENMQTYPNFMGISFT